MKFLLIVLFLINISCEIFEFLPNNGNVEDKKSSTLYVDSTTMEWFKETQKHILDKSSGR